MTRKKKKDDTPWRVARRYTVRCRYYDDDGEAIVDHPGGKCYFAHPWYHDWDWAKRRDMAQADMEYSDNDDDGWEEGGYGYGGSDYDDDDEEEEEEEEEEEWYTIRCRYFDDDGTPAEDCPRPTYKCKFAHPDQPEWHTAVRIQGPRPPRPPRAVRAPRYPAPPPPLRFHPDDDDPPPPRPAPRPSYARTPPARVAASFYPQFSATLAPPAATKAFPPQPLPAPAPTSFHA
ncbi:hypothetical protein HDZ31DRAFT_69585, partial [Schizophyllum fasciatum]